ncbi:hypothetical protein GLOIN_2v1725441 [Rhizophagus irregularis DAOM 181602=DAOM 197198]|uniref:Uncharacterized protein n=1 Tax=Rhizophagus irregularis (strain DAOM 181602 / DAOM 197198 / MUCL 43194) TaxID=747089 RepID=A0A2P4P107_RHIID|nr:hypothetical protein GLOIN_2v1725441 [Rhizophagus irregularis DAOM 181602=DAOM 197198]POG59072.1 hypothetical protein GLOIN_2v1725441 [Rhizophagus irregularis DAOM 181602=DAOM 197198]|eukprot:XP_025165938.1 hypothetical protein GLOIN_2v1725441 [Rhizophagus irregularis DAOM 181602=DAOM 197198]
MIVLNLSECLCKIPYQKSRIYPVIIAIGLSVFFFYFWKFDCRNIISIIAIVLF